VLPEKTWLVAIMNKAGAKNTACFLPQDYNAKQETYAVRNANVHGRSCCTIRSRQPHRADSKSALVGARRRGIGNLTEAQYTVIQSDSTRLAALATGETDFVIDPPFRTWRR